MSLPIAKTLKNYVGGKFVRTESGRSFPVKNRKGELYAHVGQSSRKDLRDAVENALATQGDWASRSAFNRGQILYRVAEMLEGRRREFVELFSEVLGQTETEAQASVTSAIESFVYYAGFTDKYQQLSSTLNPINGPFANFTSPDPTGLIVLVPEKVFDFGRFAAHLSAIICSGNVALVWLDRETCPALVSLLGELLATSDVPGGTVNILTGDLKEVLEHLGSHREIRGVSWQRADSVEIKRVQELSIDNLKRVVLPRGEAKSLEAILDHVEFKTVWQPVGF